ncbi:MAG: DUF2953 domain-containing protein [Ruminococcaceae bacterium]|nr:DUF2953 domain-containing protein [Oscillospiraceae bacterium]
MKLIPVILLCLLAFFVLLFVVPIRIICKIQTAGKVDFSLAVQVLFVRIPILPVKKRLPNIRKFRRGALERLYAKKQKKAEAAARKKEKKTQKKELKQKKQEDRAKKTGYTPKKRGVRHIIKLVLALTRALLGRFGRYLRVDIAYLEITAATGDAANTAILYGWLWAAMENFWNLLSKTRMFGRIRKDSISIYADFLAEKPSVRGKIIFSIALWQLFALLIAGGGAALSVETEARKNETAEQREARRRQEAEARAQVIRELKNR